MTVIPPTPSARVELLVQVAADIGLLKELGDDITPAQALTLERLRIDRHRLLRVSGLRRAIAPLLRVDDELAKDFH